MKNKMIFILYLQYAIQFFEICLIKCVIGNVGVIKSDVCYISKLLSSNKYSFYMASCATPVIHVWWFYVYYLYRNIDVIHV